MKPYTSERLINFHSCIPLHEILNTFRMRFVIASRYDSGGSFLWSFYKILREMWSNSVPRRYMRVCLYQAKRYQLGRQATSKKYWLSSLAQNVFHLNITGGDFQQFIFGLKALYVRRGWSLRYFLLQDDTTGVCLFTRPEKAEYINLDEPVFVFPYRGKHSAALYNILRKKYTRLNSVYRHDRYFCNRRIFLKGVIRQSVHARVAKYQARTRRRTPMVFPLDRSFMN